MDFANIVGQDEIKLALSNALKNDVVTHAYIFNGEDGLGKYTIANIFAKKILCNNKNICEGESGECRSCLLFENKSHPDFFIVEAGNSSIGVEQIRDMQSHISIKPIKSSKKVFLIPDAEKMTVQAQNCLLKTLEEPPEFVTIILITNNMEVLLETIKSRAIKYTFKRNTDQEVKQYLKKNFIETEYRLDFLVAYANGNIGRAIELIESSDMQEIRDKVIDYCVNINKMKRVQIKEVMEFLEKNKDKINLILEIMLVFFRDCLLVKSVGEQISLINSDKKDIIIRGVDNFSQDRLIKNIKVIEDTINYLRRNVNFQLLIEVMFIKLQEEF